MISISLRMTAPNTDTSAGSPVTPITHSMRPLSTTGRLMPFCTPRAGSSAQTVNESSPFSMSCRAPSCTVPMRALFVLARITPVFSMMLTSRPIVRFISVTMLMASCGERSIA